MSSILSYKWIPDILNTLENNPMNFETLKKEINITSASLSRTLKILSNFMLIERKLNLDRTTVYSITKVGIKISRLFQEIIEISEASKTE